MEIRADYGQVSFSPHAWGWTLPVIRYDVPEKVFPTRVGVDLVAFLGKRRAIGFPHTRGGGPDRHVQNARSYQFSPHAWGWTLLAACQQSSHNVFPTRVGVDRGAGIMPPAKFGFPHTRGGGPSAGGSGHAGMRVFPTRVGVDL